MSDINKSESMTSRKRITQLDSEDEEKGANLKKKSSSEEAIVTSGISLLKHSQELVLLF